jgi:hypothetical protein
MTSKVKNKRPEMTCTSDASSIQEAVFDANTNPSFPIGWIEQSSSPLKWIHAILLVITKENQVILSNVLVFPYLHHQPQDLLWPAGPLWTWLTMKETAFCSDSWLQTIHKDYKLHEILIQFSPKRNNVIFLYSQFTSTGPRKKRI